MKEKFCEWFLSFKPNEVVDIFEQMITGWFSSVNNRLAIDAEILLPNLIGKKTEEEFHEDYN